MKRLLLTLLFLWTGAHSALAQVEGSNFQLPPDAMNELPPSDFRRHLNLGFSIGGVIPVDGSTNAARGVNLGATLRFSGFRPFVNGSRHMLLPVNADIGLLINDGDGAAELGNTHVELELVRFPIMNRSESIGPSLSMGGGTLRHMPGQGRITSAQLWVGRVGLLDVDAQRIGLSIGLFMVGGNALYIPAATDAPRWARTAPPTFAYAAPFLRFEVRLPNAARSRRVTLRPVDINVLLSGSHLIAESSVTVALEGLSSAHARVVTSQLYVRAGIQYLKIVQDLDDAPGTRESWVFSINAGANHDIF